jgi:hypothetical protein
MVLSKPSNEFWETWISGSEREKSSGIAEHEFYVVSDPMIAEFFLGYPRS